MGLIECDRIHHGDVLDVLRAWPADFIQTCVTSPPYYGLRDYGTKGQIGLEKRPDLFVAKMVEVFREVRRVLKKDGTLWMNLGDTYNSSAPGARNSKRWPKQARNDHQPVSRGMSANLKPKDLCGIPWRVAIALQEDGWYLRSDIIWSKPNPMPESVKDRPTKSHEYLFLLAKSKRYLYKPDAIREPAMLRDDDRPFGDAGGNRHGDEGRLYKQPSGWDSGSGSHRELVGRYPKAKWSDQPAQSSGSRIIKNVAEARANGQNHDSPFGAWRNKRTVWTINPMPFKEAHFATYPEKLVEPCILAGSNEGDIVLDPFMGSGTTALVAKRFKRRYLGIDINTDYIRLADRRIAGEPDALLTET